MFVKTWYVLWMFWEDTHPHPQLDESKPLLGKWLFNQTSIKNWLFRVPGRNAGTHSPFQKKSHASLGQHGTSVMQHQESVLLAIEHGSFAHLKQANG